MVSEIQKELENNLAEMERLIRTQKFFIGDAHKYMMRWLNVVRKMEDLEKSRDLWRKKYEDLKKVCDKLVGEKK